MRIKMDQPKSVKIEMNLDIPLNKTKCKANLFSIFNDLNINDENDLYSLSYVVNKNDAFVHKLIVHFKSVENGELFYEFINSDPNKFSYSNLIKNYIDLDEHSFTIVADDGSQQTSPADSIFVLDSCSSTPYLENQSLAIQTSYFEGISNHQNNRFKKSFYSKINEMTHSTQSEQMSLSSSSNFNFNETDNTTNSPLSKTIELYSNVKIEEEDLDVIKLYLENKRCSGGGEIVEFKLNDFKRILTVQYEEKRIRDRVLSKKSLKILRYSFKIRSGLEKRDYDLDPKTLILRNVAHRDDILDIISMFAENLVCPDNEENLVESISQSKIFKTETYYLKFKFEFDYEKLEKRLARKPKLFDRKVEIYRAFLTNSIVMRMAESESLNTELIDLHFTNKRRSGITSYEYLTEKDPFIILNLNSMDSVNACLALKHEISKKELFVEYLHNFEIIDDEINLIEKNLPAETPKIKQPETKRDEFQIPLQEPSFTFDLTSESNSRILFFWEELQYNRLKNELLEINSQITEDISNRKLIKIWCKINFQNIKLENRANYESIVLNWEKNTKQHLVKFFSEFDNQTVNIQIKDSNFFEKLKYDRLRVMITKLNEDQCELIGFKDQVKYVADLIKNLNEIFLKQAIEETTQDEITGLKLYQCRILFVNKYAKLIKDKYENIQVKINTKSGTVELKDGTRSQLDDAKKIAQEILQSIKNRLVVKKSIFLKLITQKEKKIADWLRNIPLSCVLDVDLSKNLLIIYSTDAECIEKFMIESRKEIVEREFDLNLIDSNKVQLNNLKAQIENEEEIVLIEDKNVLNICGFREKVEFVYESLCDLA